MPEPTSETPTARATISPGYRWRLVLITLMMLGFGAYCVYDWRIGYPEQVERYDAFTEIREANPDTFPDLWREKAAAEGWPEKYPKRRTDRDVFTQFLMALITVPIGLFFLFRLFRENNRWVAMDETGVTASGGHEVPWDRIKSLDETRWKTKGIAWLHYATPDGGEKKVLLDDFKSQREPIAHIVAAVQAHLNPETQPAEPVAEAEAESTPQP
ncbi:MAG: hypothetical protein AAF800_02390 [Planctomycetota bacterium]